MNSAKIIAVSHSTASQIKPYIGNKPIKVIWHGIDKTIFKLIPNLSKKDLGLPDQLTLFYTGSLSNRKNFSGLIEVCRNISIPFTLIISGSQLNAQLARKFKKISNLTFFNPGYVKLTRLVEFYNVADFYINISKLEGFGLTQIEAMACETPTVAFDLDENKRLLKDGGIIVNSPKKMAEEIVFNWQNPENYEKILIKMNKRITHFSWDKNVRSLIQYLGKRI